MERTVLPRAVQVADPGDSCSKTLRTNISETVLVLLIKYHSSWDMSLSSFGVCELSPPHSSSGPGGARHSSFSSLAI